MVRDDGVVVGWVKEVWPCAEDPRRPVEPGSSSRTKPDSPWHRRTWRPRHSAAGLRDGRKSFSWRDYRDPLIAAHQQLGGPVVPVWDNLNVHKAADLRKFAEARYWPTSTICRPTHPTSTQSRGSGPSCDAAGSRSEPIDGCLAEAGLAIRPTW